MFGGTGLTAPDPYAHFFAPRRLAVRMSDIYSSLMPEMETPVPLSTPEPGGGAPGGTVIDPLRFNPVAADRVRPVAIWRTDCWPTWCGRLPKRRCSRCPGHGRSRTCSGPIWRTPGGSG